jgi:hypothetical protein
MGKPALTNDRFGQPYAELVAEAGSIGAHIGEASRVTRRIPIDETSCRVESEHGSVIRMIEVGDPIDDIDYNWTQEVFVANPDALKTLSEPALLPSWLEPVGAPRRTHEEILAAAQRTGAFARNASHAGRLSPDTCGCTIDRIIDGARYRLVDDKNEVREVFTHPQEVEVRFGVVRHKCEHHAHLPNRAAHHTAVIEENQRKNTFQGAIHRDVPGGKELEYRWSFDSQRRLVVDVTGHGPVAANAIRGLLGRPEFAGKVDVRG